MCVLEMSCQVFSPLLSSPLPAVLLESDWWYVTVHFYRRVLPISETLTGKQANMEISKLFKHSVSSPVRRNSLASKRLVCECARLTVSSTTQILPKDTSPSVQEEPGIEQRTLQLAEEQVKCTFIQ